MVDQKMEKINEAGEKILNLKVYLNKYSNSIQYSIMLTILFLLISSQAAELRSVFSLLEYVSHS